MNIRILNIKYNLNFEDYLYINHPKERSFEMKGYIIDFFLNDYIKCTVEIPSNKELTIDEIKEKIEKMFSKRK